MPRKLRRPKNRAAEIAPAILAYLQTGEHPESPGDALTLLEKTDAGLREDWEAVKDAVLENWIAERPGSRPWGWWMYDAPSPQRRRLGGVGTPSCECLAYEPRFEAGLPVDWIAPFDVLFYTGRAVDVDGDPIAPENLGNDFRGRAVDADDPPRFESEAAYLRRHGLLSASELRRLVATDFAPVAIVVDEDGGLLS
jgi:hypothetical protein